MGKTLLKSILYAIQGAIVGVGAILPGISGGVLCVAFGIYEPMMELFTHPIRTLKTHYRMFIPFILGWALGFIFLAKGVEMLFELCPTLILMLFFGLIAGTVPELFRATERRDPGRSWTPFVLTLSLAYLFFHLLENGGTATVETSFVAYIVSGALWGLSIIIPGLSSSSVLIFLGLYTPLTRGIGDLDMQVVIPFAIGICATVFLLARLATMLFEKHNCIISRVIPGFMVASALKIIPSSFTDLAEILLSLALFGIGFGVSMAMDRAKRRNEEKQ